MTIPLTISERQFTRQVLELAKLYRWRRLHLRPARTKYGWATAVAGDGKAWPDLYMVRGRRAVAAELKVGTNQPTAEQLEWLAALAEAGAETFVWWPRDWGEIIEVLK